MSNFGDLIKAAKEKAPVEEIETPTEAPKNATASLADALKNRKQSPIISGNNEDKKTGGFKFGGGSKKTLAEKHIENVEKHMENYQKEPQLQEKRPQAIIIEDFVHPEQPEKFTAEEAQTILNNMQIIRDNMEDKDIVAQVMRQVLLAIKNNENLRDLMKPEDAGLMVRHLRTEYKIEYTKKAGKSTKKQEAAKEIDEIADALGEGFSF